MTKLRFPLAAGVLLTLNLGACSYVLDNLPGVYTLEIQQGNIVDQDMIDQLKPRMSKRQVLFLLGSPMLKDAFHPGRWDYIYSDKISGEERVQKRLTLLFNGDELVGMQGDLHPGSGQPRRPKETTAMVPKRRLEKTLWETVTGWFGFGNEVRDGNDPEDMKPKPSEPVV